MKKILIALVAASLLISVLVSCNMTVIDTTWSFERAIVMLPNGVVVEGNVQSWTEFDSSDMIQVKIDDNVYFTHSTNVCLISDWK